MGGGGDWQHSLAALREGTTANVLLDLSGSGADGGMLESCVEAVGVERLLWGSDLTMDTGWAKLRYLTHLLSGPELEQVRWKNAARIFPRGRFPSDCCASTSTPCSGPIPGAACPAPRPRRCAPPWAGRASTKRG